MSQSKKSKAVALRYNASEDTAPIVIASGYGATAEKIVDIAEQRGIPVFRDDSAASIMCMLDVGSAIPESLYQIIASLYLEIIKTSANIKEKNVANTQTATSLRRSILSQTQKKHLSKK